MYISVVWSSSDVAEEIYAEITDCCSGPSRLKNAPAKKVSGRAATPFAQFRPSLERKAVTLTLMLSNAISVTITSIMQALQHTRRAELYPLRLRATIKQLYSAHPLSNATSTRYAPFGNQYIPNQFWPFA